MLAPSALVGGLKPASGFVLNGKKMHQRSVGSRGWVASLPWIKANVDKSAYCTIPFKKHRYLMPLDPEIAKTCKRFEQPKPMRMKQAMAASSSTAAV